LHTADITGTVIVAPEGLSRFYLTGTSGRVGASWMTRADRLAEVEDQNSYLSQLLARLLTQCPSDVRVTILGFSQGTATVSRWLTRNATTWRPHQLVLWAGDFPADIDDVAARQLLVQLPVTLISGNQDEYVPADKLQEQADTLQQQGARVATLHFEGGHTLNREVLHQLHATPLV
jgi:predicted esterase